MTNEIENRLRPMRDFKSALENAVQQKTKVRIPLEEFFESPPKVHFYGWCGGSDSGAYSGDRDLPSANFSGSLVLEYEPYPELDIQRRPVGYINIGEIKTVITYQENPIIDCCESGISISNIVDYGNRRVPSGGWLEIGKIK